MASQRKPSCPKAVKHFQSASHGDYWSPASAGLLMLSQLQKPVIACCLLRKPQGTLSVASVSLYQAERDLPLYVMCL